MRIKLLIAICSLVLVSCKQKEKKESAAKTTLKETLIKQVNFEELKPLLEQKDGKTHIINFWATWCKPCVDELPAFEKLHANLNPDKVEVLLVSLDFPNQIEEALLPFIKERQLKPEVIVLDDPDQNKWINGVDKSWSGAIPATLIYNKDKRAFYEQSFDYDTLLTEVQKFTN